MFKNKIYFILLANLLCFNATQSSFQAGKQKKWTSFRERVPRLVWQSSSFLLHPIKNLIKPDNLEKRWKLAQELDSIRKKHPEINEKIGLKDEIVICVVTFVNCINKVRSYHRELASRYSKGSSRCEKFLSKLHAGKAKRYYDSFQLDDLYCSSYNNELENLSLSYLKFVALSSKFMANRCLARYAFSTSFKNSKITDALRKNGITYPSNELMEELLEEYDSTKKSCTV